MLQRIYIMFLARIREFYRDKGSFSWNFIFPFFLIASFYFIFANEDRSMFKVAYMEPKMSSEFFDINYINFIPLEEKDKGVESVRLYKTDMFLEGVGDEIHFWVNKDSPQGFILKKLLSAYSEKKVVEKNLPGRSIRYLDWVLPGIIAMNMMYSCLWGVGYVITRYREDEYLKRLKVTPLRAYEFLLSQALSRYLISMVVGTVIYIGAKAVINFEMQGSYLLLFFIFSLSVFCFTSLGLFVSSRVTSKELMDGILNVITWPMLIFSGAFFSMEDSSLGVTIFSSMLPLTHMVSALRAIMLDGASFLDVLPQALYMLSFAGFFVLLSHIFFRWTID